MENPFNDFEELVGLVCISYECLPDGDILEFSDGSIVIIRDGERN